MPIVQRPTPNKGEHRLLAEWGQFEANCVYGFVQPRESLQPNIFTMGSITMEKDLKTSEESNTPEMPTTHEEHRHSPRLQCTGIAGIQTLPACEKPCPARIVNLSEGGCLMKSDRPHDLLMDEMVELIFSVNGLPFHVRGKVRAIRSDTVVGFQFPRMSERVRRQLQELIQELIEQLAKLHDESVARHRKEAIAKHAHDLAALTAHNAWTSHRRKPAVNQHEDAVSRLTPNKRWY